MPAFFLPQNVVTAIEVFSLFLSPLLDGWQPYRSQRERGNRIGNESGNGVFFGRVKREAVGR